MAKCSGDNTPRKSTENSQLESLGSAEETKKETNIAASNKKEEWPSDLSTLSVNDVGNLLIRLNFGEYVDLFAKNLIDGSLLIDLSHEDMKSLGLPQFHCKKMIKFINGWRPIQ